jgi:hypothetical protein
MSRVHLALTTATEDGVACCYARQDKVWVDGPSGEPWEIYTVLADVEMPVGPARTVDPVPGAGCCATTTDDRRRDDRRRRRRRGVGLLLSNACPVHEGS